MAELNNSSNTGVLAATPSTPTPVNGSFTPTPLSSFGSGACGMWLVIMSVMDNITAIQNYNSQGLMPLSTAVENTNEANAEYWINIMSASDPNNQYNPKKGDKAPSWDPYMSDQVNIQNIIAWLNAGNDPSTASTLMQEATTTFNTHNTLYSQANTFWSGINNGLNQSSSDTSQTQQVDIQMIGQGPLVQMQTLAQII